MQRFYRKEPLLSKIKWSAFRQSRPTIYFKLLVKRIAVQSRVLAYQIQIRSFYWKTKQRKTCRIKIGCFSEMTQVNKQQAINRAFTSWTIRVVEATIHLATEHLVCQVCNARSILDQECFLQRPNPIGLWSKIGKLNTLTSSSWMKRIPLKMMKVKK